MTDSTPDRRQVFRLAAVGALALVAAGCGSGDERRPAPSRTFPPPRPGRALDMIQAPSRPKRILWTVDDGAAADVVSGYVGFARDSGTPLTFCPLPIYEQNWKPHADTLRSLSDAGQVQLVNHTFHHRDLTSLSDAQVRTELQDAEHWFQDTFGVTARPYWRPPAGAKDRRVKEIAGELGYTRVLLWNASFGDSGPVGSDQVRTAIDHAVRAGAVILGHANQPTILPMLDDVTQLAGRRGLTFATPDAIWGTSRLTG